MRNELQLLQVTFQPASHAPLPHSAFRIPHSAMSRPPLLVRSPGEPRDAAFEFDALFTGLYPSLFRYLQRLTGDVDAAEDAAQEAFVRLLGRSMPEREARLWLFTVATNLVRDAARRQKRRSTLLALWATPPPVPPRPDEAAERAQRVAGARAALDAVPERDRQLLLMRQEGFTYEEIARVAGVAPSSVGTLLARALRRFAGAYGDPEREDGDDPR